MKRIVYLGVVIEAELNLDESTLKQMACEKVAEACSQNNYNDIAVEIEDIEEDNNELR